MAGATLVRPRDAVPAADRLAAARLTAALRPDPDRARVGPDPRILLSLFPLLLVPFPVAALLAVHAPAWPVDAVDWRQWLDPGAFALAALVFAGWFVWQFMRVAGRYAASRPDSPEAASFEFFRAAQRNPGRLGELCSLHARPEAGRPVHHWLTAAAAPLIDSTKAMARYWNALLRGNPEILRTIKLRALAITTPRGDVAQARCALRVRSVRRVRAQAAWIPAVAVAVAPFALGPTPIAEAGLYFWPVALGALILAPAAWWLTRKALGAVAETRDIVVQKLLVRSSYNWRVLYAEWEADAEASLGWMSAK